MKVLVTGAAGFIGSQVCRHLVARGDEVTALVLPGESRARLGSLSPLTVVELDLARDENALAALLEASRPDQVVHLAWYADPRDYLTSKENLRSLDATVRLAERAFGAGCRKLVGVGTCLEYAIAHRPVVESDAADPGSLYASAKLGAWLVVRALAAQAGAEVAWARVFHLYGPGENPSRLVPSVLASLRAGREIGVTAGAQVRDYLHVADVASGIVALCEQGAIGVHNVCSGTPRPLRDVLTILGDLTGRRELLRFGARAYAPDEVMHLAGRSDRLRALGWAPRFETLEQGLRDVLEATS